MKEEEKLKQACLCLNDKKVAHAMSQKAFDTFIKPKFADIDDDRLQIIFKQMFDICMNGISLGRQMPLEEIDDFIVTEVNVEKLTTN